MADYSHEKLKDLIKQIDEGRVVLPAMQRNFVWPEKKICDLFDSIMHDYPIGTFLFWKIDKDTFCEYVFNTFIKDYKENNTGTPQRGERASADFSDYLAVLDGQQRITSLYMGIKGKYHTHKKGRKWDDPTSFFDRVLCLNILHTPVEDYDAYEFSFQDVNEVEKLEKNKDGEYVFWVPVGKISGIEDTADYTDEIHNKYPEITDGMRTAARKVMNKLIHALNMDVNYYEARDKSLPEVVDIFVRVNNGGEKLKSSDLMLSVAAGQQGDTDIHVKLQEAIDIINAVPEDEENGFKVDKELILTAGLMMTGAKKLSLKQKENYSSERMSTIFQDKWDEIINALKSTVAYIEYLGFNGRKLNGRNLILPIAYYFYKNNISDLHKKSSARAECDRIFIRQWLLRTIVNNVFDEGTGSTLLQMRNLLDRSDKKHFPLEEFMLAAIKKPILIEDEQIEDILELKYGDSKIIPIYNELNSIFNNPNHQVDHIWPKALLLSKRAIKNLHPLATDDDIKQFKNSCHTMANLQLIDKLWNQHKSDKEYKVWLGTYFPNENTKKQYMHTSFIPENVSYEFKDFLLFTEKRKEILWEELKIAFPSDFSKLVQRYGLESKI